MERRPVIGITTYAPDGKPPAFSLPTGYVRAVALSDGVPLLLAPSPGAAEALLDRIDGLLLSGGGDIDPAVHRGGEHPTVYGVSRERDEFELRLVRLALQRPELPVLGICRGMQVINVALGGDLVLHLPDSRGESVVHRLPPREPTRHPVTLDSQTRLSRLYDLTEFDVCSWHHQEVGTLGSGLVPIARAADGVIEALAHEEDASLLGVQWHPELQIDDEPLQRRLFDWLVEHAAGRG
ncbi:MAG: gamma-glutamyl-gamma-aminobutyrate hydrolase family protein [Myxococcota bacterium]